MISRPTLAWRHLSLSQQFMLASLVILLAGMLGVGVWVGRQIAEGVIHRTASTTALYVESFISPQIQELASGGSLTPEHQAGLSRLLSETPLGSEIVAFKVWGPGGKVLFSTNPSMSGLVYPVTPGLSRAWRGWVSSRISGLENDENLGERAQYTHLLETYAPVREQGTNRVIAVAEFYQLADALDAEVREAQRQSWLAVALASLATYLMLNGIVRRGSDTIRRQREELQDKVERLTGLLEQNHELNERVQRAARRTAELNEQYLRRVSSELHDGPTQDLSLSLLRLGTLRNQVGTCSDEACPLHQDDMLAEELETIQFSLGRALQDLRAISNGLRLPELERLTLADTVARAVRAHERRTSSRVAVEIEECSPRPVSLPVKIAVYRLIQEGLSNAFRHGGGVDQRVRITCAPWSLDLEVSDRGPGFEWKGIPAGGQHLGLTSMRERVESLGGEFRVETAPGAGTRLVARLPVRVGDEPDVSIEMAA